MVCLELDHGRLTRLDTIDPHQFSGVACKTHNRIFPNSRGGFPRHIESAGEMASTFWNAGELFPEFLRK